MFLNTFTLISWWWLSGVDIIMKAVFLNRTILGGGARGLEAVVVIQPLAKINFKITINFKNTSKTPSHCTINQA